jgi:hypothetical protein
MTDDKAPTSLPPVPSAAKAKGAEAPDHLPLAESQPARFQENVLEHARKCTQCGKLGRVVSNHNGINVFCSCGYHWPISAAPLDPMVPMIPDRGFSKHTLVQPDFDNAWTDPGGMANESFGPQKPGK